MRDVRTNIDKLCCVKYNNGAYLTYTDDGLPLFSSTEVRIHMLIMQSFELNQLITQASSKTVHNF